MDSKELFLNKAVSREETLDVYISMRVTPLDRQLLNRLARERGTSRSALLRQFVVSLRSQ
jgi:uncharacterized protein (DUF1778 family)